VPPPPARGVLVEFVEGQRRFAIIDAGEAGEVDGDDEVLVLAVLGGQRQLAALLEAVHIGLVDHELGGAALRIAQHVGHAHRLAAVDLPGDAERQQHPERHRGHGKQAALLARVVAQQERAEELVALRHHDLAHDAGALAVLLGVADLEPVLVRRGGRGLVAGGRRLLRRRGRRGRLRARTGLRKDLARGKRQRGNSHAGGEKRFERHRYSLGFPSDPAVLWAALRCEPFNGRIRAIT